MDPNFEGPKIPLLTLAGITNLSDVLQELPLPGPHPDTLEYSLFAYLPTSMPAIRRLTNNTDPSTILNVIDALSATSTCDIVLKDPLQDKDCLGGLNVPPLLQAIFSKQPDIFSSKKEFSSGIGSNIKHSSPVQAATPQSPAISCKGLPLYQASPVECASQVSAGPVQTDSHSHHRSLDDSKVSMSEFMVESSARKSPEENPKICLKIRRKKKHTKGSAPNNSAADGELECASPVHYGIVSGPEKQRSMPSPGHLKLKLSRVKTEPAAFAQQQPSTQGRMVQHNLPSYNSTHFGHQVNPNQQPGMVDNTRLNPQLCIPRLDHISTSDTRTPTAKTGIVEHAHLQAKMRSPLPPPPSSLPYPQQAVSLQDISTAHQNSAQHKRPKSHKTVENQTRTASGKPRKKNSQHIRVKFIADQEEADIYKLSDVLYPDDSEIPSFDELKSGMMVVAKWPQNGKMYEALVIDHLESTGRKFRERKPLKPSRAGSGFKNQLEPAAASPRVVLEPLKFPYADRKFSDDQFSAYHSLADRIKLKRKRRLHDKTSDKKRKLSESVHQALITVTSDDEDEKDDVSTRMVSHSSSKSKRERRRIAELRMMRDGGAASGSLKRFLAVTELIFGDVGIRNNVSPHDRPACEDMLISPSRLRELRSESAKLKAMGVFNQVPTKSLIRLLTILEPNIRASTKLNPLDIKGDVTPHVLKWKQEETMECVHASADSALAALYLMTSIDMPKAVFIEDVMEQIILLLRFQLGNAIYPEYDTVYKVHKKHNSKGGNKELNTSSSKQKRAHYKGTKSKLVSHLYNKMVSLVTLLVELLEIQPLTDTSVLQVSSIAVSPFFVENVRELQLSAIRLTTTVFSRYERHRKIILEDIFQSLARLPTSKRNLRSFRLNYVDDDYSDDEESVGNQVVPCIQMVSALILQMVQAIVVLPVILAADEKETDDVKIDELKVIQSYDSAWRTAQSFLGVFLKKCSTKSEEIDYRPLFENFIHDLLATVNKPEWPGSEMMLSILGRLLVHTFTNKHAEASLRVTSIDYLGIVTAKLRRDTVSSQLDINVIEQLLANLDKASDEKQEDSGQEKQGQVESAENGKDSPSQTVGATSKKDNALEIRLQTILLDYIKSNADADPALMFAHNFYVGQWLRDIVRESAEVQNAASETKIDPDVDSSISTMDAQSQLLQKCERKKNLFLRLANLIATEQCKDNNFNNSVLSSTTPSKRKQRNISSQLTYDNAVLMTRYLASNRPFSHAFDTYLTHILHVREEAAVAVRSRAIKCLAEVVAVDPSVLARNDIWQGVQSSMVDASTSVREAAVDLVGKFILLKPELVPKYYAMLTARILDTGVSVRKRVIKILRDLCHEHPDLPQLTDACVRIIRRVNDEEGIKKLVHEVFMRMWFTPLRQQNAHNMRLKALSIADVVAANRDIGYEWIEQMMFDLIDTEQVNDAVELACQQIVDSVIKHLICIEQESKDEADGVRSKDQSSEKSTNEADNIALNGDYESDISSEKQSSHDKAIIIALKGRKPQEMIAATMRTLVLFAKIRPKLLVPHVMTLQPHLATKCQSSDELQTLQSVCSILEFAVPHLEHPGEAFLASLEEDLMKLIIREKFLVVKSAIACLGAVTEHVTQNYKLVWECFQKLGTFLHGMKSQHQKSGFGKLFNAKISQLLRTLFIIGHLMKTFDFDDELIKGSMQICVKDKVYDCVHYFTQVEAHEELRRYAVGSLGLLMIKDPNMMFRTETKECYNQLLAPHQESDALKNQVLLNLQTYLSDEDVRMQGAAKASNLKKKEDPSTMGLHARKQFELQKHQLEESEDIKEICDVSSGMASSVMQVYLKQVLECFFHPHLHVRHAALNTIYLTLNQGLVHPLQCVPYIIAMSTDSSQLISGKSEQLLTEISKRYPGFIHAKSLLGVKMAFRLQQAVNDRREVTRGGRASRNAEESGTSNKACCAHLYTLIRTDRKHRRALMLGLMNLFDDTVKSDLGLLVFVSDNLAYFPYATQDEPLYVMSQIEVYVSVSGSNVLQTFKECLKLTEKKNKRKEKTPHVREVTDATDDESSSSSSDSEISDSDEETGLVSQLPDDDAPLLEFVESSMACLLLMRVKQHLKTVFGFTDNKIHRYSPCEPAKSNAKQVVKKRPELLFHPKQVCDYLKRKSLGTLPENPSKDEEFRKMVVKQYTEFNELMNKLDPNDADSDSDKETPTKKVDKKPSVGQGAASSADSDGPKVEGHEMPDEDDSDRDSDDMQKTTSALDLIRKSGVSKHQKKLKSRESKGRAESPFPAAPKELRVRKKAVKYAESQNSDDSDDEFLGF